MPLQFWDDAFSTAVYIINRLPTPVIQNSTPLDILLNKSLIILSLRCLDVVCFLVFIHIMLINLISDLSHVHFLDIVINTRGISVLVPMVASIFLDMSSFINLAFLLLKLTNLLCLLIIPPNCHHYIFLFLPL